MNTPDSTTDRRKAEYSPEDLIIIRMLTAVIHIVGIDADTLASEYAKADRLQAFLDCFGNLVDGEEVEK